MRIFAPLKTHSLGVRRATADRGVRGTELRAAARREMALGEQVVGVQFVLGHTAVEGPVRDRRLELIVVEFAGK